MHVWMMEKDFSQLVFVPVQIALCLFCCYKVDSETILDNGLGFILFLQCHDGVYSCILGSRWTLINYTTHSLNKLTKALFEFFKINAFMYRVGGIKVLLVLSN
ncbi:rho guanine nucleotide exchange factor 10-like protein [Platysternon megacephalum]|uniref:Rho guanine nucleotide exchange factor 10-like protein n=1 Tax=Platysternon megacephalum TaxID=55544 RepID=A0A4D9ERL3_9SAUR|nr:rho guanine nucleotide exchange factor 10-like protein [Platysternon megacephalum]